VNHVPVIASSFWVFGRHSHRMLLFSNPFTSNFLKADIVNGLAGLIWSLLAEKALSHSQSPFLIPDCLHMLICSNFSSFF
jgi:hypothetical protein